MVSIATAARDIGRIRDVARVLIQHGFGEVVARLGVGRLLGRRREDTAPEPDLSEVASPEAQERGNRARKEQAASVRMRLVLQDLGPSFVKLGQFASMRPDILPAELITELRKLQDAVPPIDLALVRDQIHRCLGAETEELFAEFDPQPLAAGSIAQVHRAVLRTEDGPQAVAVKVQRPGIAETVASDVAILHTLATLVERAIPESRVYSPVGLVQQFDRAMTAELDFTTEAENANRFAHNFESYPAVKFPRVHRQASGKLVLTLEYLDGIKVDQATEHGHSGKRLARLAMDTIVKQVFEDGFFHADPHPGNVIILGSPEEPVIALIDLGMVGRLSPRMRDLTLDLMIAAVRRDYEAMADVVYALGTPTRKVDQRAFRAEVALLADKYLDRRLQDVELSSLIRELVQGATRFGLEIPTDFTLVAKAVMTIESIGKQLDPDLEVLNEAKPLFLDLLRKRYSPERLGNELLRRLERFGNATYNVPERIEELLEDLRLGRLRIQTDNPTTRGAFDRLGRRILVGLVVGALTLAGSWLLPSAHAAAGVVLLSLAGILLAGHSTVDLYRGWRDRR